MSPFFTTTRFGPLAVEVLAVLDLGLEVAGVTSLATVLGALGVVFAVLFAEFFTVDVGLALAEIVLLGFSLLPELLGRTRATSVSTLGVASATDGESGLN